LFINEEDSLWGVLVHNGTDSFPFTYTYVQEEYLRIDSSNSDFWKGELEILNQGNRSLRLKLPNDSCSKSEWLFEK
jgi:hypothetical protein